MMIDVRLKRGWTVAEVVKENRKTVIVRLRDGHIIKRSWRRDTRGVPGKSVEPLA